MKFKSLFLFIISLYILSSCSVNPVTGDRDFVLVTEDRELEMGRQYHSMITQYEEIYRDPSIEDYVQSVGEALSEKSHRSNIVYRFTVLDNPEVNAFALPGGYVYINRGLMAYLSSESELAAVLGHEIGHITARHSVKKVSQAQLLNLLSYAVARSAGRGAGDLAGLGGGALLAGYGREMELEADSLGAQYMVDNGYSAKGMLNTISVLKEHELYSKEIAERRGLEPQTYHGIFSTHPSNDKRLQELIQKAESSKDKVLTQRSSNYLQKIDGMIYGDSESQGIRRKEGYYHKLLDIKIIPPKDWEIINKSDLLLFLSPKGKASMELSVKDQSRKESPNEHLRRLFGQELEQQEDLIINGLKASIAIVNQGYRSYRAACIYKDKRIFTFLGTSDSKISSFDGQFKSIINSFSELDSKDLKLAEPLTLQLYEVKKGDTYKSLAQQSPLYSDAESRLRLLNGDYPTGNLETGILIKVVK